MASECGQFHRQLEARPWWAEPKQKSQAQQNESRPSAVALPFTGVREEEGHDKAGSGAQDDTAVFAEVLKGQVHTCDKRRLSLKIGDCICKRCSVLGIGRKRWQLNASVNLCSRSCSDARAHLCSRIR